MLNMVNTFVQLIYYGSFSTPKKLTDLSYKTKLISISDQAFGLGFSWVRQYIWMEVDSGGEIHGKAEPVFVNLLRSPGIDFQPGGPVRHPCLTYRPPGT